MQPKKDQPGTDLSRLNAWQSEMFRKSYLNVLEVLNVLEELSSDSEKYFGFAVDEFSELVHTTKLLCSRYLKYLWFDLPVRNSHRIWTEILKQTSWEYSKFVWSNHGIQNINLVF